MCIWRKPPGPSVSTLHRSSSLFFIQRLATVNVCLLPGLSIACSIKIFHVASLNPGPSIATRLLSGVFCFLSSDGQRLSTSGFAELPSQLNFFMCSELKSGSFDCHTALVLELVSISGFAELPAQLNFSIYVAS
jgi:hypothetical protein